MAWRRTSFEATLSSAWGEQRLTRTRLNELSRASLIPSEPLAPWPRPMIDWRAGQFELELTTGLAVPFVLEGRELGAGVHALRDGAELRIGQTPVRLAVREEQWPVNVERERALVERDEPSAWAVYADELLGTGDPLVSWLVPTAERAFDVALAIEVQPLLATKRLEPTLDSRGLWAALSIRHTLHHGELSEGVFAAVLGHPIAWFLRSVALELKPIGRSPWTAISATANRAITSISTWGGPWLRTLSLPGIPAKVSLEAPRAGVELRREQPRH